MRKMRSPRRSSESRLSTAGIRERRTRIDGHEVANDIHSRHQERIGQPSNRTGPGETSTPDPRRL